MPTNRAEGGPAQPIAKPPHCQLELTQHRSPYMRCLESPLPRTKSSVSNAGGFSSSRPRSDLSR